MTTQPPPATPPTLAHLTEALVEAALAYTDSWETVAVRHSIDLTEIGDPLSLGLILAARRVRQARAGRCVTCGTSVDAAGDVYCWSCGFEQRTSQARLEEGAG